MRVDELTTPKVKYTSYFQDGSHLKKFIWLWTIAYLYFLEFCVEKGVGFF